MTRILLVGAGGFIGSILRYLLSGAMQRWADGFIFPYGTFAVNSIGCIAIGFLYYLAEAYGLLSDHHRAFLIVGVLGGFTTFSTFANESFNLMRDGEAFWAMLNISGQVFLGLFGVWLGRSAAFWIWR